jgi:hypothetical protein
MTFEEFLAQYSTEAELVLFEQMLAGATPAFDNAMAAKLVVAKFELLRNEFAKANAPKRETQHDVQMRLDPTPLTDRSGLMLPPDRITIGQMRGGTLFNLPVDKK